MPPPEQLRAMMFTGKLAAALFMREADAAGFKAWKERTQAYLTGRNYGKIVENYCRALEKHSDFVRRYAFLYLPPQP